MLPPTKPVASPRHGPASQLRGHLRLPLFRNAYLLILGAAAGSAMGFVFWILAARHYSAEVLGRNSATVSAMIVVSGIAQLGLNGVLIRYVPSSGRSTRRLVLLSYAVSVFVAAGASAVAALTSETWAPTLRFLRNDGTWFAMFVVATVAWTIFSLQDSVMTGMRQAGWVPVENSLFSLVKLLLLVAVAGSLPGAGVFVAWNVPVLLALAPVNLLIFRRLLPLHVRDGEETMFGGGELLRFAAGNYAGSLFFLGSTTLLPVVVASASSARTTAYFYIPWTISTALQLIALNMTTSLTVEVAFDESKLRDYCRRVLQHTLRLVVPLTIVLVSGASYLLRIFGGAYADQGTMLLRLLGLSTIPNIVVVLGLSVARIQRSGRMVLWTQGTLCVLTLGLSIALLPPLGIEGVGAAYLVSQTVVAAWLIRGILQPVLLTRPSRSPGVT